MKTTVLLRAMAWGAVLAVGATAAQAQPYILRYEDQPGVKRVFEQTVRKVTTIRQEENSRRTVTEQTVTREELVLDRQPAAEGQPEPTVARLAVLTTSKTERLVALEENGQDVLSRVPEDRRSRTFPPTLQIQTRGPRGTASAPPESVANPVEALAALFTACHQLPEQPISQGDEFSTELDLGVLRATIRTRFTAIETVNDKPCAVLERTATAAFQGEHADRLRVDEWRIRLAVAIDGGGTQTKSGTTVLHEKTNAADQQVEETFESRCVGSTRLDQAQLAKARADAERIQRAFDQAQADDLDAALQTLRAYAQENPDGPWTPAAGAMRAGLEQRRLLTKPLPAEELRVVLRDLRIAYDRANAQGNASLSVELQARASRVADNNLETLIAEAADADPIVRELAAFGLTFASDETARPHLVKLAKDRSGSVRGGAAIGLAIQGRPVEAALLTALLKDAEERTRGAAALLAYRTVTREHAQASAMVPLLLENLTMKEPWARAQTVGAVGALAPSGSTPVVAALVQACKKDTEPPPVGSGLRQLKPIYLNALRGITGLEGKEVGFYEAWLQKHAPEAIEEPEPKKSKEPAPKVPKG